MCHEQWTDETRLDTSSHFAENTFHTMTWHSRHRHNLRDRLGTPYLQSLGLNKVYHSDLMHNVSQLVCEKSSFWGGGGIWHHHGGKARGHGGAEFDAKE
jgi:hypothetical protein